MRVREFLTPITEIITVDELVQPSDDIIEIIKRETVYSIDNHPGIYYAVLDNQLLIASKVDEELQGYLIGTLLSSPTTTVISKYICPKNMYSWAKDGGKTALAMIRATISLAREYGYPVLSDIQMTVPAKKFMKKVVENGNITGKVFNLVTGQISAYDPDIWEIDDEYRILLMQHSNESYNKNRLIREGTWNWKQLNTRS